MRSWTRILLLGALGIALGAAAAPGQDLTSDRVRLELQRTDERIQQGEALLAMGGNDAAAAELGLARQIQQLARDSFDAGFLAPAMRRTLEARSHADRAIVLLRGLDFDRIRDQLQRTHDYIDQARERLGDCEVVRARAQLRLAEQMILRADDAFAGGRPLAALQLSRGGRDHARRALQLCRMEESLQDAAERALQRTDDLLARTRDQIGATDSPPARRALDRAIGLQDAAWREFRAGRLEPALRLTQGARTFAQRALRLSGGGR